jgi:hypothetical protein
LEPLDINSHRATLRFASQQDRAWPQQWPVLVVTFRKSGIDALLMDDVYLTA